jgi:uncharacterized membrane protein
VLAIFKAILVTALVLGYPYLVYRGMELGFVWLAPVVISGIYIYKAFTTQNQKSRYIKLGIALIFAIAAVFLQSLAAKLMPVFIQLGLMCFFGRTLFKPPPLVERFARMDFPDLPPGVVEYCRLWTIIWTGFFALNALICAGLAFWAPNDWWAFYTGIMLYVLTGALMIGEFCWRHFRFPEFDIPTLKLSMRNMIVNGRKIWSDVIAG